MKIANYSIEATPGQELGVMLTVTLSNGITLSGGITEREAADLILHQANTLFVYDSICVLLAEIYEEDDRITDILEDISTID